MRKHKNDTEDKISNFENLFKDTSKAIQTKLPDKPFHIYKGLNVAAFDCVYVAFAIHLTKVPENIHERYLSLKSNAKFHELISSATTDEIVVRDR